MKILFVVLLVVCLIAVSIVIAIKIANTEPCCEQHDWKHDDKFNRFRCRKCNMVVF